MLKADCILKENQSSLRDVFGAVENYQTQNKESRDLNEETHRNGEGAVEGL